MRKSSCKREVQRDKCLPQEMRKSQYNLNLHLKEPENEQMKTKVSGRKEIKIKVERNKIETKDNRKELVL